MRKNNLVLLSLLFASFLLLSACVSTNTKNTQASTSNVEVSSTQKSAGLTNSNAENSASNKSKADNSSSKIETEKVDKNSLFSVAVMNFKVAVDSGNPEVYLLALKEAFFPELDAAKKVKSIEREQFDKLLSELELSRSDLSDEALALKIGKQIGVRYMIFGTATKAMSQIKFTCRVVNTETGEVVCSLQERGSADSFYDVAETLAKKTIALLESRI